LAAAEVGAELSSREDQIARLYVDGLSYKEIGAISQSRRRPSAPT
jgi:DNA-binding CsgD family transcriptional regulator